MKLKHRIGLFTILSTFMILMHGCTKVGKGFLSPYVQYAVNEFTVQRCHLTSSGSIITDGSTIPLKAKWVHIYDSTGKIVDDLFTKKYPVTVWTQFYNTATDTTYASIIAKITKDELTPITMNESNGVIRANFATINLPLGRYTMDVEVTNESGPQTIPKMITMNLVDGKPIEIAETDYFSLSLLEAGTANSAGVIYNLANNPFVQYTITKIADTPNVFTLKVTDRNGVAFNPKAGEFVRRPAPGYNPDPPFYQNLQTFIPDAYVATDSTISIKYPITPFPILLLSSNFQYNMYYRIPTEYIHIDYTSDWPSNPSGEFYTGESDSHYLGTYDDGDYDYAFRFPLRIYVPGSYLVTMKILNVVHK